MSDAARLRGTLTRVSIGARGVSTLAVSDCSRLRAVLAAETTPSHVARSAYGDIIDEAISPFATAAGRTHEAGLYTADAATLIALYRDARILDDRPVTVDDYRNLDVDADDLIERTLAHVSAAANGGDAPDIIIEAAVELRLGPGRQVLRPDLLVRPASGGPYRVGEAKSYLDRGGLTDGSAIAAACRQAAAGAAAIDQHLTRTGSPARTPTDADLVLRRRGERHASLHTLPIDAEILAISRALTAVDHDVRAALDRAGIGALTTQTGLEQIPHRYRAGCHGHCALADRCRTEAATRGDLAVIGDSAAETLAVFGTIDSATAACHGEHHGTSARSVVTALNAAWAASADTEADR